MGILNVTPDSFSDGGSYVDPDIAVKAALRLIDEGAHIIDIGGESTRPGADEIDIKTEITRTVPVIMGLREALRDRLTALIAAEQADEVPAEDSFAALFENLPEDGWEDLLREVEARVTALLAPAGQGAFTLSRGTQGAVNYVFTQGESENTGLPVPTPEAEEVATETQAEIDDLLADTAARIEDPKADHDKAADLLAARLSLFLPRR